MMYKSKMRSLFEESIQTVNNMFYNLLNAWTQKKIENQFTTLNHFLFWIFACRYNDIKQDIAEELASLREEGATLENVSDIRYWSLHDDKQK